MIIIHHVSEDLCVPRAGMNRSTEHGAIEAVCVALTLLQIWEAQTVGHALIALSTCKALHGGAKFWRWGVGMGEGGAGVAIQGNAAIGTLTWGAVSAGGRA